MRTAVSTASSHGTHTLHTLYRRLHCRAENMRSVCSWDPACSSPSRLCRRRACPASSRAQEGAREGHHHTHRPCLTPLPCQLSPLPIPPLALERRGQRTDLRTESGRSGGGGSGCGCGGSGRLRRRRPGGWLAVAAAAAAATNAPIRDWSGVDEGSWAVCVTSR